MARKNGFTLIELLIAMSVSSLLILGLIYILSTIMNAEAKQSQFVKAQDAVRIVSLTIEKDIRESSQELQIRNEGSCIHIDDTKFISTKSYCLDGSTLKLNDAIISDNVIFFDITKVGMKINIIVHSEFREDIIDYEKTIFLR